MHAGLHPLRRAQGVVSGAQDLARYIDRAERNANVNMHQQFERRNRQGGGPSMPANEALGTLIDFLRSPGALPVRPVERRPPPTARIIPPSIARRRVGSIEEDGSFGVRGGGVYDPTPEACALGSRGRSTP